MESTLKKGDKVIMMEGRCDIGTYTCANDSELVYEDVKHPVVEVVELEGQSFKCRVSRLKKVEPTVLTDEELARMVTDIFQPAVDAVKKLANAMHTVAEPKKSLKEYLQKLANKHNVSFMSTVHAKVVFYVSGILKNADAEDFFDFDRKDFDDDFYYNDRITPEKYDGNIWRVNCKCNINPNVGEQ